MHAVPDSSGWGGNACSHSCAFAATAMPRDLRRPERCCPTWPIVAGRRGFGVRYVAKTCPRANAPTDLLSAAVSKGYAPAANSVRSGRRFSDAASANRAATSRDDHYRPQATRMPAPGCSPIRYPERVLRAMAIPVSAGYDRAAAWCVRSVLREGPRDGAYGCLPRKQLAAGGIG